MDMSSNYNNNAEKSNKFSLKQQKVEESGNNITGN